MKLWIQEVYRVTTFVIYTGDCYMQVYLTVNIRGAFATGMGVPFFNFLCQEWFQTNHMVHLNVPREDILWHHEGKFTILCLLRNFLSPLFITYGKK